MLLMKNKALTNNHLQKKRVTLWPLDFERITKVQVRDSHIYKYITFYHKVAQFTKFTKKKNFSCSRLLIFSFQIKQQKFDQAILRVL